MSTNNTDPNLTRKDSGVKFSRKKLSDVGKTVVDKENGDQNLTSEDISKSNKNIKKVPGIDDYKLYVRKLKTKIANLENKLSTQDRDKRLASSNVNTKTENNWAKDLPDITKKVTKLQSAMRQALAIKKLKSLKYDKMHDTTSMRLEDNILWDEQIIKEFNVAVKKKGFNCEMLYRAADVSHYKEIRTNEFKLFLEKIRLPLAKTKISRVIYVLDEDHTGIIEEQEYLNVLEAYGIRSEG